MLLQGMLRMDPPLDAVKKILDAFPLSCVDMEAFFTACQFAQPRTSRQLRPIALGKMDAADSYDDDVGDVVRLIMHKTILARRSNNIGWSMVAFLGELLRQIILLEVERVFTTYILIWWLFFLIVKPFIL
jgi:hypothetical protein